jgi:hypothetical protein
MELPPELNKVMQELWTDLQQTGRRREAEAAKAAPAKHKLTTVFDGPMRWLYYKPIRTAGRETRYCYSTTRNVAGYFLTWREVHTDRRVRRDMFRASKRRKTVAEAALARCKAHRARITK